MSVLHHKNGQHLRVCFGFVSICGGTFVEKTELYLELFGNSLVRRQCMDYVEKMATEFIKYVA